MKLGETIYRLRTEKGMSQGDLAEALEVSRQSVSKWETGSSVPELDKLVRLSQLFGVTLDELVTGEPEKQEGPPPAPPEEAPKAPARRSKRVTAGLVLLGLGALVWLLLTVAFGVGGLFLGLIFALTFLLCAVICFVCRKNAGLWCAWAVFFCMDGLLYYATGITWRLVLTTLYFDPSWNYTRLAIAWVLLCFTVALVAGTVIHLRKEPLQPDRARISYLVAGWALFVLLNLPIPVGRELRILSKLEVMVFKLTEWVRLGLLAAMLTYTVRYIRTKREKKTKS